MMMMMAGEVFGWNTHYAIQVRMMMHKSFWMEYMLCNIGEEITKDIWYGRTVVSLEPFTLDLMVYEILV